MVSAFRIKIEKSLYLFEIIFLITFNGIMSIIEGDVLATSGFNKLEARSWRMSDKLKLESVSESLTKPLDEDEQVFA